ncbi:MAG: hypothetical protein LUG60_10265 [Erysipelotrichaceae bacterium]|nr:hypothetical protein [Erysipelotrichaceae bacterium]
MKKLIIILCIFVLFGCSQKLKKADAIDNVTDIIITIDNLTNTSASLYIEEGGYTGCGISEWFRIDILKDDGWYELNYIQDDVSFEDTFWYSSAGEEHMNCDWEDMYGELSSGTYRLVKEVYITEDEREYIYVEFNI